MLRPLGRPSPRLLLLLLLLLLRERPGLLLMVERTVLFVCVANASRSLMAEAIFNADPPAGWHATSAGTSPAAAPNPRVGLMLREIGLDLPAHPPRALTNELIDGAQIRVTMGCLDDAHCPAHLKSVELRDWALPDPARLDDAGYRAVRDEIRARVAGLRSELALRDRPAADRVPSARP